MGLGFIGMLWSAVYVSSLDTMASPPLIVKKRLPVWSLCWQLLTIPAILVHFLARPADVSSLHGPELSGLLPLSDVKAVKKALECSVNNVLMACVTGAPQRYLPVITPSEVHVSVPVTMRTAKDFENLVLENKFTPYVNLN